MATARLLDIGRWRALLGLLWSAGRGRALRFGALVLAMGVLPTVAMVLTGALVAALPAAAADGVGSPAAQPALLALGALVGAMVLLEACANALLVQTGVLNADYALEVHHTVARVSLGAPGVARLEDPAFADELQAVQDEERRGILQRTVSELCTGSTSGNCTCSPTSTRRQGCSRSASIASAPTTRRPRLTGWSWRRSTGTPSPTRGPKTR